jgi:hypothetical protein
MEDWFLRILNTLLWYHLNVLYNFKTKLNLKTSISNDQGQIKTFISD